MRDSKRTKPTKNPIISPTAKQKLLRSASRLMSSGFCLLPLKVPTPGDSRSGKVPACKHGVKDATNDFKKFKRLVKSLTEFNIGLATGGTSRIVVVDIDPRNGGEATLKALQQKHGPLPKTVTVKTGGGGLHLYYTAPKEKLRSTVLGDGVDFLAEGKYAVVPPSLHGSGSKYLWAKGASPSKVAVASLPKPWRDFIPDPARKASPKADQEPNVTITEGNRNNELTKLAGRLRASGLGETEIIEALTAINANRCDPPLEQAEVEAIARNIARYPVRDLVQIADAGEQLAQVVLDRHFDGGAHLRYEKDGQFWRWRGSHWAPIDDKVLQRVVFETAKTLPVKARTKTLSTRRSPFSPYNKLAKATCCISRTIRRQ